MKREEFKELCELSEEILGHKYAWKKLRTQGLMSDVQRVGRRGTVARRMPLSNAGVKHYLLQTKEMRKQIQQEMEKENNE